MAYVLFPGRHHLLTAFQHAYLQAVVSGRAKFLNDGKSGAGADKAGDAVEGIVFAVTSANHWGTRRNPVPFYLRAAQIEAFASDLGVPFWAYGIDDVGTVDDFASYVIKKIQHESDGSLVLSPENCAVLCSTRMLEQYESLGFAVFPAELADRACWTYSASLPWDCVEKIVGRFREKKESWHEDAELRNLVHPASLDVWRRYSLARKTEVLFDDSMLGDDGDLTETRDYNSYVRQMDEIADLKWADTGAFAQPGRIGDIGCAVGSWLKSAAADPRLRESDFYGIELSRPLYDICLQRKASGDFGVSEVFFARKNAVDPCFAASSMDTVHSSSLTHEIFSYGSPEELRKFIAARFGELVPGGVWINRDVIGPESGERLVYVILRQDDGVDLSPGLEASPELLSTQGRFRLFLREWMPSIYPSLGRLGDCVREEERDGLRYTVLPLHVICDFALKKDYTRNWRSEMHEAFCFWSFSDWRREIECVGFSVSPSSRAWRNDWIYQNRIKPSIELFELNPSGAIVPMPWPETHMVLLARK